jgi:hypothetical protein
MYLRGSSFTQKWQVESPVNSNGFYNSHSQQGPLNILREQTLATQSYLSQHRLSSTLANQGWMPEEVKHNYQFCQYHNPALAHDNGPCDCLARTNGTKWNSSVPPILAVTLSLSSQGECFVPIYAAKVVMKTLHHLPKVLSGRWLVVYSDILAGSECFTGNSNFTIACIYKEPLAWSQ